MNDVPLEPLLYNEMLILCQKHEWLLWCAVIKLPGLLMSKYQTNVTALHLYSFLQYAYKDIIVFVAF